MGKMFPSFIPSAHTGKSSSALGIHRLDPHPIDPHKTEDVGSE